MNKKDRKAAEFHFGEMLRLMGQDQCREGLVNTRKRYIDFLDDFLNPEPPSWTTFSDEGADQMIVQKDIRFYSLCEHHTLPFFGYAHIAYIPDGKIIGLSKLARAVKYVSSGLQNQERITQEVARLLQEKLSPKGVAVRLTAQHLCMSMRGIESHEALTTTTALEGVFKCSQESKNEFFNQIQ